MPLLKVVLEDFNRPEELADMLEHLLKADMFLYRAEERQIDDEYIDRQYFIGCLITPAGAGL